MPGRQPLLEDIPPNLVCAVTPPPNSQAPTNVLLLLHGIGDGHKPFTTFGQRLQLPETTCISLRAPNPMPFDLGGYHWGDDIVFDQATGNIDPDAGYRKSTDTVLDRLIKQTLLAKCGYTMRQIFIYGFGQGGTVALSVAASLASDGKELGGVVSIGGPLPPAVTAMISNKSKTPVLLCKGNSGSAVAESDEGRLKAAFQYTQIVRWNKIGDAMPANRDEMLPIMQFFARYLRSVRGAPAGSVELTY